MRVRFCYIIHMKNRYPDRETAEKELTLAGGLNPGPWINHSRNVAKACSIIAERCPSLDAEKAYILGLLHDIGRRVGIVQERHMLAGYQYCKVPGITECRED